MALTPDEEIELLTDAGLLTERQAEVYVLRNIECTPGEAVADHLGIGDSAVSLAKSAAEEKIEEAQATVEALEQIRDQVPEDV